MPKEFFIYEFDQALNICICDSKQMEFIAINYFEHYNAPIDILMWLYDMAEYRDYEIEMKKIEDAYLKKKPVQSTAARAKSEHVKKKAAKVSDDEVDYEESGFGNAFPTKAKKAPPSKPVFSGKQLSEKEKKEKEEKGKKKLEQMKKQQEEKERRAAKKDKKVEDL
jgi:hypothetical protein